MKQKIAITGGAGTLGRAFVDYFAKRGDVVFCVDNNEWALAAMKNYVQEYPNVDLVMGDVLFTPQNVDLLIHCAAYKHVDLCERNIEASRQNNVEKTKELFKQSNAKLKLFISTDKAVEPTSVYGTHKMHAEEEAKKAGAIIARLGNIYGSSGSVIPIWEKCIEEGKPLPVTSLDMQRYFIDVNEAVEKIMALLPKARKCQVIVPDMGEEVSIRTMIQQVLKSHNLARDYPIVEIGVKRGEKMREVLTWRDEVKTYHSEAGNIYKREQHD